jgi:tRNA-dihydrouridine synthase
MNLNMGCPYPVVTKKKKGAGMLQDVAYLRKFFDIVFSSVAVPLGVKLRLGLKDKQEVLQVIAVLNDYPVQEVVIHPRIGTQYYSGKPDLVMFSKCLDQLQPPVVYNGDIFTAEDYKNVLRQFPAVSKVMIGRGILRDPFLAMRLRNQLVSEAVLESIYGFQQDLFEAMRMRKKNPNQFPQGMKEYWWYLSQSFEHPAAVFQQVKRVQTVKEYEQVVAMIFQQQKIRF